MMEAGVVVVAGKPVFWHLPEGRTAGSLPDSRALWDVFWEHRKEPELGFAHSHPGSGPPGPSDTDLTTFAAVEAALGRRLIWWITSSDHVRALTWEGPGRHDYGGPMVAEPEWARRLREASLSQEDHFREVMRRVWDHPSKDAADRSMRESLIFCAWSRTFEDGNLENFYDAVADNVRNWLAEQPPRLHD